MINKDKYLYWFRPNGSAPELNELVARELYARVGYFLHLAQMVEYNLANILSLSHTKIDYLKNYTQQEIQMIKEETMTDYEKESKKQFYKLIEDFKSANYSSENFEDLDSIRSFRNYLAHQIFVELNHNKGIENLEYDDFLIEKINDMEAKAVNINDKLVLLFEFLRTTHLVNNPNESNKA